MEGMWQEITGGLESLKQGAFGIAAAVVGLAIVPAAYKFVKGLIYKAA